MLQLNHIDLATEDDKANNLVYWAKLFNASTWEEFTALAGDNPDIEEVGTMIFTLNTDNQTAEILEGQRRYREMLATARADGVKDTEERLGAVIAEKDAKIAEKDAEIAEDKATIKRLTAELESLKKQNEQ